MILQQGEFVDFVKFVWQNEMPTKELNLNTYTNLYQHAVIMLEACVITNFCDYEIDNTFFATLLSPVLSSALSINTATSEIFCAEKTPEP